MNDPERMKDLFQLLKALGVQNTEGGWKRECKVTREGKNVKVGYAFFNEIEFSSEERAAGFERMVSRLLDGLRFEKR